MLIDWSPFLITLKVASITTFFLIILGTPIAFVMAHMKGLKKAVFEALVALPLVLPPTVLGFYLLVAMGESGPLGGLAKSFGLKPFTFSFSGLVIGSFFYSLPFALQPLMNGFEQLGKRPSETASALGAGPIDRFFSVTLPLMRRHYLIAGTLSFAHTVGEFGVVLMIGGNIPGVTKVASIAIYDHVEVLEYDKAHFLSAIMLVFSLVILTFVYGMNRRAEVKLK